MRATPIGAAQVRWITVVTSGVVETRDSIAFTALGPQELSRTVTLPFQPLTGTLTITGSASAGEGAVSDAETVAVRDDLAPVILGFNASGGPKAPGDVIVFRARVRDSVGVERLRLRVDNSFRAADSIVFNVAERATIDTFFVVRVPNDAALGVTAIAWLTAVDESQQSAEAQFTVPIQDFRPPVAIMTLGGLRDDQTIGTGDTIQITVNATDNHRLTYIGLAGPGVRDSVVASGLAASHTYRVPVLPAWRQQRPTFHVWARDLSGNLSTIVDGTAKVLPVYDWVDHPMASQFFSNLPFPVDVVWDAKRSVAYLLRFDPDGDGPNSQIEVIRVPSGTLGARIPVPGHPEGFSLTASGDSLIIVRPDLRALGIVDLTSAATPVSVVPLQYDIVIDTDLQIDQTMRPRLSRAVGSHVFVTLVHGLFKARLLDVNLASGVQTVRTDFGNSGQLTQYPVLFSLADGRLVLNRQDDHSNIETFLYSGTTNTFATTAPLRAAGPAQFSSSASGRFMLGNVVYDAMLNKVDTVATQDWKENYGAASALSADGESVYLSTSYGYEKVRISDTFVLEQVKLSTQPFLLRALPDGNTLLAIAGRPGSNTGEYVVLVIDLR